MTAREKIIDLINKMRSQTVDRGCTPAEAAAFAAKVSEWIEKYQIEEAELRVATSGAEAQNIEVCENILRTGKKVHNPGMTSIVNSLARGMSCECILTWQQKEAVYGVVGEELDATYVCQLATTVVPALQVMARLEGAEHGYDKAELVRWVNRYLDGASIEIYNRLFAERWERAEEKRRAAGGSTALVITGETIAADKAKAAKSALEQLYPGAKAGRRSSRKADELAAAANQRGREAGKKVGLHVGITGG